MKRRTPFWYFTLAAFAAVAPFYAAPPQAFAQQQQTLYQRLGGYDALAAVSRIRQHVIDSATDFTTRWCQVRTASVLGNPGTCLTNGLPAKQAHLSG